MSGEALTGYPPTLSEIQERAAASLAALPDQFKAIENPATYPVHNSARLQAMCQHAKEHYGNGNTH